MYLFKILLTHDAMLVWDMPSSCVSVSVWVYVCVSFTIQYCIKTAKHRMTKIMPHDSPGTLVFWCQRSRRYSNVVTPYWGDKYRLGGLKSATFNKKRAITQKRYEIDAQFLLKLNKTSYALYRMAMLLMTLGDP